MEGAQEEDVLSPEAAEQRKWEQQQAMTYQELSNRFSSPSESHQPPAFSPVSPALSTPHVEPNSYANYTSRTVSSAAPSPVSQPAPIQPPPQSSAAPEAAYAAPLHTQPPPTSTAPAYQSQQAPAYSALSNTRDGVLPSAFAAPEAHIDARPSPYAATPSPRDIDFTPRSEATSREGSRVTPLTSGHGRPPVASAKRYPSDVAAGPQGLRDHADFLCKYMGGKVTVAEVAEFLQPLERTKGLIELCQRNATAGSLFAAIYHTYNDCFDAICCLQNASRLQDFCLDLICLLEAAGKKGVLVPDDLCTDLVATFKQGSDLIATFSSAGWLLHMAFMQDIKGRFDAVQNQAVRALQAAELDTLVQHKTLMFGDYKDPSRSLRRVLKQLGKGSIADGIYEVIATNTYRAKIAAVLEVSYTALSEELANFPQGDQSVDLAMLYDNLIAGKVTAKMNDADLLDHEKIFDWYDSGRKGYMDMADLKAVLHDLGMLDPVKDKDQFVATQMSMADKDQTKSLSLQEFSNYYSSLVFSGERHQLRTKMGIEAENELKHQFLAFSNYGIRSEVVTDMDGKTFAKYAQDCKLISSKVRNSDIDLIFCKVKAKGARRIDFDRFLHALSLIAEKKEVSFVDTVTHCLKYEGPVTTATRAENTRLHDDKSTYTGVYARGGPTNVEPNVDLSHITDRSKADARGVKLPPAPRLWNAPQLRRSTTDGSQTHRRIASAATPPHALGHAHSISSVGEVGRMSGSGGYSADRNQRTPPASVNGARQAPDSTPPRRPPVWEGLDEVQNSFVSFAMFGKRTTEDEFNVRTVKLDGASFSKLCKESALMDNRLNSTRVDLIFTKFADHKTKRMSYKQFVAAITALAEAKGVEPAVISKAIADCPGPMLKGTIAASVRWHDDKNTYTGVYKNGGPTNVDKKMNLEDMVNRSSAEHRQYRRQSFGPRDFALR